MVQQLNQMELQKAAHIHFNIEAQEERELLENDIHILDFLNKSGRGNLERRAVINHICIALYADMLHYIYEGLRALEKRKFTVAFTLFRKPFKEGLLITAQMCADEEKFFTQMKRNAKGLLNRRAWNEESIKTLLESALDACNARIFTKADSIYASLFDRKNEAGMAGLFDKATHLVTEFSQIRTENYNINFIFKNPMDNDVYEGDTYSQLATVLLLLNLMQFELYSRMTPPNEGYKEWVLFTSMGVYESLFIAGRSRMTNFVNHHLSEFMICPVCQAKLKVKKADIPRLFIAETLDCPNCYTNHHFPFGWLLSKTHIGIAT